jgi:trk system potassium uptake protein
VINLRPIARVLAVLLFLIGGLMWTGLPVSWFFQSGDALPLFYSGLISLVAGALLWLAPLPGNNAIKKREGYLIVATGWLVMALFGMLPYLFSGVIPQLSSAFFEAVSGTTTTGATVLTDIEATPKGILYWRSLTQWIGGMGIVVLTVAIFPLLGIGGIELFGAEAPGSPGPTSDKIHPRIQETAKRLWLIYVALTGLLGLLLYLAGMSWYEAINHALTTMATGGFSTRNDSIAAFADAPLIQYIIIAFMFLAGTNFTLIYFGLKRKFSKVWKSDEFRVYLFLVGILTVIVTLTVKTKTGLGWENAFRDSLFQIIAIVTTTGFVSADYTAWGSSMTMLFLIMMFLGASTGSTSGGIKLLRHLVFFKNSILEFKRILHPRALVPLKINGQIVAGRVLMHIIIFLLLYLILFVVGVIVTSIMGLDFMTAVGAVATSLGNVGPGIGMVGPVDNFAWLPEHTKLFLAFLMLLGRLEIFTILVLFTPYFWKAN